MTKGTPLGKRVADVMVTGELVPDAVMINLLMPRVLAANDANGYRNWGIGRAPRPGLTRLQGRTQDFLRRGHHRLLAVFIDGLPHEHPVGRDVKPFRQKQEIAHARRDASVLLRSDSFRHCGHGDSRRVQDISLGELRAVLAEADTGAVLLVQVVGPARSRSERIVDLRDRGGGEERGEGENK